MKNYVKNENQTYTITISEEDFENNFCLCEDCEVYVLYEDNDYGKRIPVGKLEFLGNGEIVDAFSSVYSSGFRDTSFRKDAVAIL